MMSGGIFQKYLDQFYQMHRVGNSALFILDDLSHLTSHLLFGQGPSERIEAPSSSEFTNTADN